MLGLSVKGLEIEEEKKAMQTYGSADSGATLGDILGAALSAKEASGTTIDEPNERNPKSAEDDLSHEGDRHPCRLMRDASDRTPAAAAPR